VTPDIKLDTGLILFMFRAVRLVTIYIPIPALCHEMKYMRRTAGYAWTDYKTNTQNTKELKITPILDKLLEYKRNWM